MRARILRRRHVTGQPHCSPAAAWSRLRFLGGGARTGPIGPPDPQHRAGAGVPGPLDRAGPAGGRPPHRAPRTSRGAALDASVNVPGGAEPPTRETAARAGRAVSVCGGRHAMGGQPFGTDTVLMDTRGLDRVRRLDADAGVVEVEAGIPGPEAVRGGRRVLHDRQRPRPGGAAPASATRSSSATPTTTGAAPSRSTPPTTSRPPARSTGPTPTSSASASTGTTTPSTARRARRARR